MFGQYGSHRWFPVRKLKAVKDLAPRPGLAHHTNPTFMTTPAKKQKTISVAVVEDDADVRHSLISILNGEPCLTCVGAFESGEEALKNIPGRSQPPQLVLMDINLPGMSGIECVRQLTTIHPGIQVLMLTVYHDSDDIFDSLAAGAIGYLLKPVRAVELVQAIQEVHAGGAPMSTKIARQVVQAFKKSEPQPADLPDLSPREHEVISLLAKGFQSKEIAAQLGIGYWTIETHISHIYQKLHVRTRAQAVAKFFKT